MFNCFVLVLMSMLSAASIILWIWVSIVMMETLVCRDAKSAGFTALFRMLFTREVCVAFARIKRRFHLGHITGVHIASFIFMICSYIFLFYRMSELTFHVRTQNEFFKTLLSALIPFGILVLYRSKSFKISFR